MCRAEQVVTGEDSACHGSVQSETEWKTKLRFLVGALGLLAGRTRTSEGRCLSCGCSLSPAPLRLGESGK